MQTIMSLVSAYGVQGALMLAAFVTGVFVQAKHPLLAPTLKADAAAVSNAASTVTKL